MPAFLENEDGGGGGAGAGADEAFALPLSLWSFAGPGAMSSQSASASSSVPKTGANGAGPSVRMGLDGGAPVWAGRGTSRGESKEAWRFEKEEEWRGGGGRLRAAAVPGKSGQNPGCEPRGIS